MLLHVSARKWQYSVPEIWTSILCSILEIKVYVFVCHYCSQFPFKAFFILTNTHNYLSECNPQDVLKTCRTCKVFNIVDKCKPQLQCIKSDILYIDIKWDSWHIIQEGYKTISYWLTHTPKKPVDKTLWPAVQTHPLQSQNHQQHITMCQLFITLLQIPQTVTLKILSVFVRGNTLASIQLIFTKSFIKHFK
jgi:hypothetical protein